MTLPSYVKSDSMKFHSEVDINISHEIHSQNPILFVETGHN